MDKDFFPFGLDGWRMAWVASQPGPDTSGWVPFVGTKGTGKNIKAVYNKSHIVKITR